MNANVVSINSRAPKIISIYTGNVPARIGKPVETVGMHYRQQLDSAIDAGLSGIGTGLRFTAEAIPGVLLAEIAAIKGQHRLTAYQRIFDLPWDPAGKWRSEANRILAEESRKADGRINNLPMIRAAVKTGEAITATATAVGSAVVDGTSYAYQHVKRTVTDIGQTIYDGTSNVAHEGSQKYRAIGRGFLGWVANLGQGLFEWANRHKRSFTTSHD
ncbi:MAG: hypothetical protein HY692_08680 [Cyanobacteria bacterium NC_groundwater_1444_Ag_S-0.65um_54_12]|nr:hypothetical protein [Cyanobacteria bacterium NC_groundwater_1444_Ag_S-0.65um_54_12]